jgi:hypothetical protein
MAECSSYSVLDAIIGGFRESERTVSDALEDYAVQGTLLHCRGRPPPAHQSSPRRRLDPDAPGLDEDDGNGDEG